MSHKPKFEVLFAIGDWVVVGNPSPDAGKTGTVVEINDVPGTYRYVVKFDDGRTAVCFGFELFRRQARAS